MNGSDHGLQGSVTLRRKRDVGGISDRRATADAGFDQPCAIAEISPARRNGCRCFRHGIRGASRVVIRQASASRRCLAHASAKGGQLWRQSRQRSCRAISFGLARQFFREIAPEKRFRVLVTVVTAQTMLKGDGPITSRFFHNVGPMV